MITRALRAGAALVALLVVAAALAAGTGHWPPGLLVLRRPDVISFTVSWDPALAPVTYVGIALTVDGHPVSVGGTVGARGWVVPATQPWLSGELPYAGGGYRLRVRMHPRTSWLRCLVQVNGGHEQLVQEPAWYRLPDDTMECVR